MELAYLFDPNKQFQDRNGVNNVAGFLRVYYEGTDDRATTYKNFIGTLNPADIPIDNDGRAVVIVEGEKTYRLEVYTRNGNLQWTQHPLCPLVGGGGSFEQVQSNWDEDDPTSAAFIKNKPNINNGRIHRLRPVTDEVIGETSENGGWVLDLESPNENAPGGYDRLTPQRLNEILNDGAFLAIEVYDSGSYGVPLALQARVQVTNQNPLRISVDFVRQFVNGNILGFQRMKIYTPSGAESYLQMFDVGPQWRQDKEALAINGDGKDVTVTFSEASARTNISTGEKLSVLFGKIKKFFTDLASVAFSGSYNDLSDKPTIPAAQVNSDWNANSGVAQILNKPDLATVATTGDYEDLDNKPILVAVYGETTYGKVWQFAFYAGKTVVCKKLDLTAVLIADDGYSFTFATPPNIKGQYHVFTLNDDNSWTDEIIELTHDIFVATYNETSYSDVEDAYFNNGQVVFCKYRTYLYQLKHFYNNKFIFEGTVDKDDGTFETITLDSSNAWTIETHSVDEYCVYRKSYDALHPLSTAATAADISNGYMDVEFDLGNADGFAIGDGDTLVFIGVPNRGGPSGVNFADAFTKIELYAINDNDTPWLAAKVKDTSKDDYGDTLAPGNYYMWNRTYSGNGISSLIVKKFRARFYLNMNTAWVPNLATKFYIYFTILL